MLSDEQIESLATPLPPDVVLAMLDEIDALRADIELQKKIIHDLQAALAYWLPKVNGDGTPDDEIAANDAYLLFGLKDAREGSAGERMQADANRYRAFCDAGWAICFLGELYHDKPSLDAAIDAVCSGGA